MLIISVLKKVLGLFRKALRLSKRKIIQLGRKAVTGNSPLLSIGRWSTYRVLWVLSRPVKNADTGVEGGRLLYVAASTLPYHISGYTTRTQAILLALRDGGVDTVCITRPGYPSDRPDTLTSQQGSSTEVDGVTYWHTPAPTRYMPTLFYALKASKVVAHEARRLGATRIHAASNHVNALPALLAARRLGVPFSYEMRGLWELTRISRHPEFKGSHAYKQGLLLESLVAQHADRLFVISHELGRYMQDLAGVSQNKIQLLPNCMDIASLPPAQQTPGQSFVLGYAGSLMTYEGLDVLVDAVERVVAKGLPVVVKIAGDGEARAELEQAVVDKGLGSCIEFMGRVPPQAARDMIAAADAVCMPRKPYEVCRIVTPIKLVEALSMGKPAILPDLPVFRDETASGDFAFFFEAGNSQSLAQAIERLYEARGKMPGLSAAACDYVNENRLWSRFVVQL